MSVQQETERSRPIYSTSSQSLHTHDVRNVGSILGYESQPTCAVIGRISEEQVSLGNPGRLLLHACLRERAIARSWSRCSGTSLVQNVFCRPVLAVGPK